MGIAEQRQQLHQYIDSANEKDIAAFYFFLEQRSTNQQKYSEAELKEFYRRREKFQDSESKGYSVEEVHNYIRLGRSSI